MSLEVKGFEKFFISDFDSWYNESPFEIIFYGVTIVDGVFPPELESEIVDVFIDLSECKVVCYDSDFEIIYIGVIDGVSFHRKFDS